MTASKFPWWTVLGIVLVVSLVIGSGALSSSPPTAAQRAAAIDSVVRCPSCEDLSVASSSAPTALTVRATVKQLIAEGKSDQQIKDYLFARYGSSIVLEPSARGWSLLVWALPLLGGLVATAAVATVLVRRRHAVDEAPGGDGRSSLIGGVPLQERRRFLQKSLADADAEYLAGDLSDKDYLALRHRDMVRLAALDVPRAEVNRELANHSNRGVAIADHPIGTEAGDPVGTAEPAPSGRPPAVTAVRPADRPGEAAAPRSRRRGRSWWYLGAAVAAFGAALILAVSLFSADRLPGQTATGGVNLSQAQQVEETLTQAAGLENQGQLGQAAQLYQSVLNQHSGNEVALAQLGWLEYRTGQAGQSASLLSDARAKLDRAVQLDPGDYAARLYLGTVLLQEDGDAAGAVAQYHQFLADSPPASVVKQAGPEIRQAFQLAGQPVPPQVAAD